MPRCSLQLVQQIENLRLSGHIERRGRLIGDEQARVTRKRHRDHGALPQSAAQLKSIFVDPALGLGNAHLAQHLDRSLARLVFIQVAMQLDCFDDLIPNRMHRAEGGHRFLEYQANLGSADRAHFFAVGL